MSRISSFFKANTHKALIAYLTVGYPGFNTTFDAATLLAEAGCNMIELGIPFSDPMADGVTIQKASHQALLNGVTVEKCLETATKIRNTVEIPLVFMSYLNPVINYGVENFCSGCASAGIDGLIIPDLPPGELPELVDSARKHNIDVINFLSPNSSDERIKEVTGRSQGFIYIVSVTGVTGARDSFSGELEPFISRVRQVTGMPLCVGFGISNREQAVKAVRLADGVIIGSRILQILEEDRGSYHTLKDFISDIRHGIDQALP